ncbi:MAG: hypothetical protein WCE81_03960 [Halobacteriota archaeon]
MTRKTQLTRNKILKITEPIKAGNYAVTACRLAGVSERTYYHWLALGKQQESSIYAEFCEAVEQAEAEREARLVKKLEKSNDLKATMWMLERTAPERWSMRRSRVEEPVAEDVREDSKHRAHEPTDLNPVWTEAE